MVLLALFPALLIGLVFLGFHLANFFSKEKLPFSDINHAAIQFIPFVLAGVLVWFIIAWFSNSRMIQRATGSQPLERKENKRVYNLLENLCISKGIPVPRLFIIPDDSLNAFASGINKDSFSISLSRGIIEKLNDEELEGVIAHELTHIRNRDVRLLIVSIIFVGIFAFISQMAFRSIRFSGRGKKDTGVLILVVLVVALLGWLLSSLFRFSISRKREYMADAGAVELTKRPEALASALEKISSDSRIEAVEREDVAQLFIDHPLDKTKSSMLHSIFATHPPIEKRIQVLRQF